MANEVSSRSHAIFLMHITNQKTGGKQITSAKLSMIDLAGSERAAYTTNKGLRMREGANINKSLLALGNCINALSKGNKGYVPFRNSKLTRLLKDSLSGNCRTVMIANVSPGVSSYEDTLNTLKYANRAKDIKTEQKLNLREVVDEPDINNYQGLIEQLKKENVQLKRALKDSRLKHSNSVEGKGGGSNQVEGGKEGGQQEGGTSNPELLQRVGREVISHFQEEMEAFTRLYSSQEQLGSLLNSLARSMGQIDPAQSSYKDGLAQKIQENQQKADELVERRERLKTKIGEETGNEFDRVYLESLYDKERVKLVSPPSHSIISCLVTQIRKIFSFKKMKK